MLKGSELIGMPVVAYDTGEQIKVVKDLIFDQQNNLLGFLVNSPFWTKEVLPLHGIKVIGAEMIVALSQSAIVKASNAPAIKKVLEQNLVWAGTKILTEEGRNLGVITDVYFERENGAIEGYEVVSGLFADLSFGYSFVPSPSNLKMGKDVAFVPKETAELMVERASNSMEFPSLNGMTALGESQNGASGNGMQAVANGTPVSSLASTQGERVSPDSSAIEVTREPISGHSQASNSKAQILESPIITTLEPLLGCRVLRSIKTPENVYIAAQGQIVTQKVIDQAWTYSQERELVAAVCLSPTSSFSGKPSLETSLFSRQGRSILPVNHSRFHKIQQNWLQKQEQRQIQESVGYPVSRVIFNSVDEIILNKGEIITYQAIAKARQASVLNILLNSVDFSQKK